MNIALIGNKDTTGIVCRYLIRDKWPLKYVITLKENHLSVKNISGFQNYKEWNLPENIQVFHPEKYSLNCKSDKNNFSKIDIDILIVLGWQRLIPDWLLNKLTVGAFGMHGSSEKLPKGRGRSPLNWSIIQNKKYFITNLFRYKAGIDDGDIVASDKFKITKNDTGGSLQMKNTFSMIKLLSLNKLKIINNSLTYETQDNISATYYPKRRKEDGEIIWKMNASEIDRLVRAVSKPFPGAYTYIEDQKIFVWAGYVVLCDENVFSDIPEGQVIQRNSDDSLLVKTNNNLYCITSYSCPYTINSNTIFNSKTKKIWDYTKLPIIESEFCSGYNEIPDKYSKSFK